jgi:ribosome recycling factor
MTSSNPYLSQKESDLEKAIEHFQEDIKTLRTGRATPGLLEGVSVDVYGTKNPVKALGNINVEDPRTMVVVPWDKNIMKSVEKAIEDADLGVGVVNEGEKLRITIPEMTEENRKNMVKKLNEKMEEAKISIRHIRDEIKQSIEKGEKEKEISEDDKFRFLKELDKEIEEKNNFLKEIRDKKEEEIMKV